MQPPATLILGAPGAGKTDSLATFIAAGVEVFVISTEPGGVESLLDSCARRKLDISKLHWTSVQPVSGGWDAMKAMALTIGTQGFEAIQGIKSGVGKEHTRQPAMKLLESLVDFRCERDGKSYGDTSKWGADRALCLDSLSGLNVIAQALTVGYKPAMHQGEWGVAMNFIEQLVLKMLSDRRCHFACTAHVEKEPDMLTGVNKIMASTLGRKLAPKLPRFFSEVVLATRAKSKDNSADFHWSTISNDADLKNRVLAISDHLPQDFKPIVDAYNARLKAAGVATPQATPVAAQMTKPASASLMPNAPMRPVATTW